MRTSTTAYGIFGKAHPLNIVPRKRDVRRCETTLRAMPGRQLERKGAGCPSKQLGFSSQRLDFDNRGAVITSHPERRGAGRIVHEHSPDVCGPRKEVFAESTRFWIHPKHTVVRYRSTPDVTILVHDDIVRRAPCSGRHPLLEALGARIEHANAIDTVLGKPEAIVGVHPAPARS